MDIERSPVEVLGDIIDEVEGLRRTDSRSFLPPRLVALARAAVAFGAASANANRTGLHDLTDLVGRTVAHVFDSGDLRRDYDAVLLCSDGGYLVLTAEGDGDDAYIAAAHVGGSLADIVRHESLERAGLLSKKDAEELRRKEREKRVTEARQQVERAAAQLKRAEDELAKLAPAAAREAQHA